MQVSTLLLKIYGQWFHALGFSLCTTDHVYFDSRVIGSSQLEVKLKSLGSNTLCGVCCTPTSQFSPLRAAVWSGLWPSSQWRFLAVSETVPAGCNCVTNLCFVLKMRLFIFTLSDVCFVQIFVKNVLT